MPDSVLDGLRVIDLSQGIAGPYCTRIAPVILSGDRSLAQTSASTRRNLGGRGLVGQAACAQAIYGGFA